MAVSWHRLGNMNMIIKVMPLNKSYSTIATQQHFRQKQYSVCALFLPGLCFKNVGEKRRLFIVERVLHLHKGIYPNKTL